jgi:hypothetical protein
MPEMSLQTETDAAIMKVYSTATIEDLERGIVTAELQASCGNQHRKYEWYHMLSLLRAELQRRKEATE